MLARGGIRPGFRLVFWREVGWLWRRPFLLGLATLVPLTQMAFLAAVFSAGLATRLPIGVLDLDRTCRAPSSEWSTQPRTPPWRYASAILRKGAA